MMTAMPAVATTPSSMDPHVEQTCALAATNDNVQWLTVEVNSPGTLGQEVLYQVNMLSDVEYIRVKGTMNTDDWQTLKNMANLKGADLSQAKAEAVPDDQFRDLKQFHVINLPQGVKRIGVRAFSGTAIETVTIPATVTTIGNYAFSDCWSLTTANIAGGSALTEMGYDVFAYCSALNSISLPNGITELKSSVFYGCSSLTSAILPATLKSIGSSCFYGTPSLKNIDFPQTLTRLGDGAFAGSGLESVLLPENLEAMGSQAFASCYSLKTVVLPATPNIDNLYTNNWGYSFSFSDCPSIEKVTCLSATPPLVQGDPFSNDAMSQATLVVPAFAIVDYKLDDYWHQFGTIVEGAEPSVLNIGSALTLTNNRRPEKKADIILSEGAQLTVGGSAPLPISMLTFTVNPAHWNHDNGWPAGQLLNNTAAVSADQMQTRLHVYSDQWYYITPLHDVNVGDVSHSDTEASFIFRYYNGQNRAANGPTGSWQNLTENTLHAGQGYILQTNREGWITLPATQSGKAAALLSSDATTTLRTYNAASSADASWNFVGNPYPCCYDAYYMDMDAPIIVWDRNSWTYRAYSPIDDDYILRPMEAFFVQKPANLSQIRFQQEGRQFSNENQRPAAARREKDDSRQLLDLTITDGTATDQTRLVLNEQSSLRYETARDAARFFSQEAAVPQIYTLDADGTPLAINERPLADGVIHLGLQANQGGTFTIALARGNADSLLLTDATTGVTTDLSQHDYTFTINEASTLNDRFTLTIANGTTAVSLVAVPQQQQSNQIFDLQGRIIKGQLTKGIYVKNGKKQVVK